MEVNECVCYLCQWGYVVSHVCVFVCLFVCLVGLSLLVVCVFVTRKHHWAYSHKIWIWAQNRTRLTSGGDPDKRRVQEFFLTFPQMCVFFVVFLLTFLSLPGGIIHKSWNISRIIHGMWILDLVSFNYKKFLILWISEWYRVIKCDWIKLSWIKVDC